MENTCLVEANENTKVLEIENCIKNKDNTDATFVINANYYSQLITRNIFEEVPVLRESFKEFIRRKISKRYDYTINFRINIKFEKKCIEKEKQVLHAIDKFIDESIQIKKLELKECFRKIIYSAVVGLIFMFCLFKGEEILLENLNNLMLIEGVKVCCWMYMWQAFQILGFDVLEIKKEINALNKFNKLHKFYFKNNC